MRRLCALLFAAALLLAGVLFAPPPSGADRLTRAELFLLYVQLVPDETVAQRMNQLLALVPANSQAEAKTALRNDLATALTARRARVQAIFLNPIDQADEDLAESTFDE